MGASGNAALPARVVFGDRATPRTASGGYSTPKNRLAPGDATRMAVRIEEEMGSESNSPSRDHAVGL